MKFKPTYWFTALWGYMVKIIKQQLHKSLIQKYLLTKFYKKFFNWLFELQNWFNRHLFFYYDHRIHVLMNILNLYKGMESSFCCCILSTINCTTWGNTGFKEIYRVKCKCLVIGYFLTKIFSLHFSLIYSIKFHLTRKKNKTIWSIDWQLNKQNNKTKYRIIS